MKLKFKEVTDETWKDFETLFQQKGGPKYCWCMAWRARGKEKSLPGPERKKLIKKFVKQSVPIGILAYLDDEPVGWCSVGPKETFNALGGMEDPDHSVWSITCFYVPRSLRQQGITRQLIGAACKYAKKNKARVVEAYPVTPDSPSYRHMGFVSIFDDAGFEMTGKVGIRRHVMIKKIR